MDHLPIGEGVIDWPEFLRLLKVQNHTGYLGLDLGSRPSLVEDLKDFAEKLEQLPADQRIQLQR